MIICGRDRGVVCWCRTVRSLRTGQAVVRGTLAVIGAAVLFGSLAALAVPPVPALAMPMPRAGEWWLTTWKLRPVVWRLTEGAGVTVAVLDTGVQASVPDLHGVVLPGGDVTGHHSDGRIDFGAAGHGTMMAALIAGQGHGDGVVGMAPAARILPVVVNASDDAAAAPGQIAAGIVYAADHGATVIDVPQEHLSSSASGCDPAEQAAVAYAISRDAVVVAAAGDTSLVGPGPAAPASCAGVLAVAAIGPQRVRWPGDAREPYLTVVNPGACLITSGRDGQLVTGLSGSRAASALAAGAVALIRARYPAMRWYQVVQRVTGTALPEGRQVPNDTFGYGIFRLSHAIDPSAFPVPAGAPNPVYARYLAWLATPQGQAVAHRLAAARPGARAATSGHSGPTARPGASGSSEQGVLAIVAVLVAAAASAAALIIRLKPELARRLTSFLGPRSLARITQVPLRRMPGRAAARLGGRHRRLDPPAVAAAGLLEELARSPFRDAPGDSAGAYLRFGESTPYRIPPYSASPRTGRGDGRLAPDAFG